MTAEKEATLKKLIVAKMQEIGLQERIILTREEMADVLFSVVKMTAENITEEQPQMRDLHYAFRGGYIEGWEHGRMPMSIDQYQHERERANGLAKDIAEKKGWSST